jgi:hypothetical protein
MHPVHAVKFVDRINTDGPLESFDALVIGPAPTAGETIPELYAIEGGILETKANVPHGSAEQGDTWF